MWELQHHSMGFWCVPRSGGGGGGRVLLKWGGRGGAMRQRIQGSHTPLCHRRMVITTLSSMFCLAALQHKPDQCLVGGMGGGVWNPNCQQFVYQKQPKSILPFVKFIFFPRMKSASEGGVWHKASVSDCFPVAAVAGHRLGALEGWRGGLPPPLSNASVGRPQKH